MYDSPLYICYVTVMKQCKIFRLPHGHTLTALEKEVIPVHREVVRHPELRSSKRWSAPISAGGGAPGSDSLHWPVLRSGFSSRLYPCCGTSLDSALINLPRTHASQIDIIGRSHRSSVEYHHDCKSVCTRWILIWPVSNETSKRRRYSEPRLPHLLCAHG